MEISHRQKRIEKEMRELELKLHYHFNDISWLAKARGSIKIGVQTVIC